MPLSEQLKSDMVGIPEDSMCGKLDGNLVVDALDSMKSKANEKETTEDDVGTSIQPIDSKDLEMLKSIDVQLKALGQNVLDLRKGISENTGTYFFTVIEKIESARASLEALLTPNLANAAEETAGETQNIPIMLQTIIAKLEKNDRQLTQTLRDNATFQIQVRQGMQQDLDNVREQLSGEQFNPLLKEIASVYVEYQSLLADESIVGLSHKNLHALFEQLEDILSDYGAEVCRSDVGLIRQTRTCKIIGKIPTSDKEKHNTIAASKKPGVVRERTVLYPEFVDVYVYDPLLTAPDQIDNENVEDVTIASETAANVAQSQLSGKLTCETPIEKIDSEKT